MSFSIALSWAIKCSAVNVKNLYIRLFNPLYTHANIIKLTGLEKIGPLIATVMIRLFLAYFLIFKCVLGILILLLTLYLLSPFQKPTTHIVHTLYLLLSCSFRYLFIINSNQYSNLHLHRECKADHKSLV